VVGNEAGEPLYRQGQEQVLPSGAVGLPQKHIFVTTTMSLAVLIECLANIQGAAEGCDLLTLIIQDQKIAACGSSYSG
jgi:hypothetical protein